MNRKYLLWIGVVLLVVGVGLRYRASGYVPRPETTIELARDGSGVCRASEPDRLSERSLRRVTWHVRNMDCEPQHIALQNFSLEKSVAKGVVSPEPVRPTPDTAIPRGSTVDLSATIQRILFWSDETFKYQIWIGTTPANLRLSRDPDIDIWPVF